MSDPTTTALILEAIGDPKTKGDEIVYLKEATSEADGKYIHSVLSVILLLKLQYHTLEDII